jgi:hypothetical protein
VRYRVKSSNANHGKSGPSSGDIVALGLAVQLVPDPDPRVQRRWERRGEMRVHDNGRVSKEALKRSKPILLAGRRAGR